MHRQDYPYPASQFFCHILRLRSSPAHYGNRVVAVLLPRQMMAYAVLKYCIPAATWTIMGDVSQNIRFGIGLNDSLLCTQKVLINIIDASLPLFRPKQPGILFYFLPAYLCYGRCVAEYPFWYWLKRLGRAERADADG